VKTLDWWFSRPINKTPLVSFVINTHNMSRQVIEIVRKLRTYPDAEIIVVEDGSEFPHTDALVRELTGENEFLLRANDLFEVLTCDRAFYFARGRYIAMLQDDDGFPSTNTWIDQAMALFEIHPKLAILGGRYDIDIRFEEGKKGGSVVLPGESFRFVQSVVAAPMWLDRRVFLELGGFDDDFAPCMFSEAEICFRGWLAGYQVGWYPPLLESCASTTKQRRTKKRPITNGFATINFEKLRVKFADELAVIDEMVRRANQ